MSRNRSGSNNPNWKAANGCEKRFDFDARANVDGEWEVDHIFPVFEGGKTELANLQALCTECHDAKSSEEKSRAAKLRHTRTAPNYRATNFEKSETIRKLTAEVDELKKAVVFLFAIHQAQHRNHQ